MIKYVSNCSCGCDILLIITFDPIAYVNYDLAEEAYVGAYDKVSPSYITTSTISKLEIHLTPLEHLLLNYTDKSKLKYHASNIVSDRVDKLDVPSAVKDAVKGAVGVPAALLSLSDYFNAVSVEKEKRYLFKETKKLPGTSQRVVLPCACGPVSEALRDAIMHLNDLHQWTRESIADWLDELADAGKIDIDFPTPDEIDFDRDAVNKKGLQPGQGLMYMKSNLDGAESPLNPCSQIYISNNSKVKILKQP